MYIAGYQNTADAESIAIARLNLDGDLDTGFDLDGRVLGTFGQDFGRAYAIARAAIGDIYVAGQTSATATGTTNFGLARYNTSGNAVTGFGTNGYVSTGFTAGVDDKAWDVVIQGDDRIVVARWTTSNGQIDFAVARYLTDGSLDNSFSNDGKVSIDFNGGEDVIHAIAIQADGKIVVAGNAQRETGDNRRIAVARFLANGELDPDFNQDGKMEVTLSNGISTTGWDLKIQPDGRILVCGSSGNGVASLARINPNGSMDGSFVNSAGYTTFQWESDPSQTFYGVELQADGKIVCAGYSADDQGFSNFLVVRFVSDGTLDNSFSGDGAVTTSFNLGVFETARDIVIQDDNKILVGGYYKNDALENEFALARYHPGPLTIGLVEYDNNPAMVNIYPNPIGDNTTIEYVLPESSQLTIELQDLRGRVIATFLNGQERSAGKHTLTFEQTGDLAEGNYLLFFSSPKGRMSVQVSK